MKRLSVKSVVVPLLALAFVALLGSGCATSGDRYVYKVAYEHPKEYHLPEGEEQIEVGRPNAFLDSMDWWWPPWNSLMGKLVLWNKKVDSHEISPETIAMTREFLAKNNIKHAKVRFNQYAPHRDFMRLVRNRAVGWPYRYSLGLLAWLNSTINPFGGIGRMSGGDHYNPYTNTINVYSDIPAVALHECGHAKDFAGRKWRGTYNMGYAFLPLFKLYPEAKATSAAVGYMRAEGMVEEEKAAYKILYPAYATYVAGETLPFIPTGPVLSVIYMPVNVITAHIAGRVKAGTVTGEPHASVAGRETL
jgi:hypothetical protein